MRNRTAPQEKAGPTRAEPNPTTAASDTTTAAPSNTAAAQRKANRKRGLQKVRRGAGQRTRLGCLDVSMSYTRIVRCERSSSGRTTQPATDVRPPRGDGRQVLAVIFLPVYLAWRWFDPRRSTAPNNPCEEGTPLVQLQSHFLKADHFDRLIHHIDHHWRLTNRCACASPTSHAPFHMRAPRLAKTLPERRPPGWLTGCTVAVRSAMLLEEEEPWGVQTAGPLARFSTKGAGFLKDDTRTFGPEVAALFDAVRHPAANAFHVSLLRHEGDAAAAAVGDGEGAPLHRSSPPRADSARRVTSLSLCLCTAPRSISTRDAGDG